MARQVRLGHGPQRPPHPGSVPRALRDTPPRRPRRERAHRAGPRVRARASSQNRPGPRLRARGAHRIPGSLATQRSDTRLGSPAAHGPGGQPPIRRRAHPRSCAGSGGRHGPASGSSRQPGPDLVRGCHLLHGHHRCAAHLATTPRCRGHRRLHRARLARRPTSGGDLTEATNNHYVGLVLKWTSGVLLGQGTTITGYEGWNGSVSKLIFDAVTDSPSSLDTFVIN